MNERIKELAEQAGCKVMDDGEWYIPSATGLEKIVYTKGIGLEKFAELIVQECISMADKESERYSNLDQEYCSMAMDNYRELVRQHFGVEECWCESCKPNTMTDMRMILCQICGNKRCPHATNHIYECTNSNEPGQKGSSWENYKVGVEL